MGRGSHDSQQACTSSCRARVEDLERRAEGPSVRERKGLTDASTHTRQCEGVNNAAKSLCMLV